MRKRDEEVVFPNAAGIDVVRMSSSMRWRNGKTVGVEMSMVLLLSMNEADCVDQQHRRSSATTNRHLPRRSALRASGLVRRPISAIRCRELVALKRPVGWAPRPPKGFPQQCGISDQGAGRRPGPLRTSPSRTNHAVPLRCSSTPTPSSSGLQANAGADLPQFARDEFDALLDCGILALSFQRLRCDDCGHDKLVATRRKRRGFCPSCGTRRMARTAAHLVDHVIPHVPVRQWVRVCQVRPPIPLRLCACVPVTGRATQADDVRAAGGAPSHHALAARAGRAKAEQAEQADSGAVTLIQPSLWMKGLSANLNIHFHCLMRDGV